MPRRSPPKLLSQSRSSETFKKYEQIATLSEARFWFGFQDAGFYQLSRAEWDNQKKQRCWFSPFCPFSLFHFPLERRQSPMQSRNFLMPTTPGGWSRRKGVSDGLCLSPERAEGREEKEKERTKVNSRGCLVRQRTERRDKSQRNWQNEN
jgi:hypothetical protein